MWAGWTDQQRQTLEREGIVYVPSDYGEPYEYSRGLMEDGQKNQILDQPINFEGPVRILQGQRDEVVPWEYSKRLVDALTSQDVEYVLVKNGDHRLSSLVDLERLVYHAKELCHVVTV